MAERPLQQSSIATFRALLEGESPKEHAHRLGICIETVKWRFLRVANRLGRSEPYKFHIATVNQCYTMRARLREMAEKHIDGWC